METFPGLSIRLLGGFELRRGGRPAARPAYDKGQALLAYLTTETSGPHSRQKLAAMLWPDLPAEAARTNLRQVVLNLRRVLGEDCLHADRNTIRLERSPRLWIDVAELSAPAPACIAKPKPAHCEPCVAQMANMADCYRGEFMAGFFLPDCPEFEDWLQAKRETLHRHALAVLERLSNCLEHAGAIDRALPYAMRYVELEPWNEEGQRRAMRLHVRGGHVAAALRQYDRHCKVLERELGVQPDEETQRLAARIRNGELTPAATPAGPPPARALPAPRAQRRRVTILYCELMLSRDCDPEDAMSELSAPQARCMEYVQRGGGHVVQRHGGSLLAYFGFPRAGEDATRRALHAALAMVRETRPGLEVRAGVHAGTIITGEDPAVPDAIGTASALAIRLRLGANAGEVAVSADTLPLVAGYFDFERCEARAAQHGGRTTGIFRVIGETGASDRLEARMNQAGSGADGLLPLVGRARELGTLTTLWDEVRRRRRSATLLLRGEAGIGKSRLLHAFKAQAAAAPHVVRELRCLPEFARAPFRPSIELLACLLDFADAGTPQERFAKLAAYVEANCKAASERAVPVAALVDGIDKLTREMPLLLVVEDLHWADASTLALLEPLAARAHALPMLVVMTARPGFALPWEGGHCATMALERLADEDIAAMVAAVSADIAPDASAHIVARADGVPLFAEEMARTASADEVAAIPATLEDLFAARLDALGEAKRVAQLAATIGRDFDVRLLAAVSDVPAEALERMLLDLRAADVLTGDTGHRLRFKHALMQEAAYHSQLKNDRQAAHARIARAMLDEYADMTGNPPEDATRHLSLGGDNALAQCRVMARPRAHANASAQQASDAGGGA